MSNNLVHYIDRTKVPKIIPVEEALRDTPLSTNINKQSVTYVSRSNQGAVVIITEDGYLWWCLKPENKNHWKRRKV